ncbi:NAD(P)/FAD-dependent oxidoreductase [Microlunatus soli]|uniref:3-phenylpropionate/trans-cinnamate dioxygenase ferredoxin reductase subunit n=1 Tax=Microlunatus soli TaxID=630515 RepID=A0A1H1XMG3_9ACTN|nr:FAD-dependent oxidoreductase [Microlunatus soli]SDT10372.1 3-phenylpropionate/trans-cinnamate dioxygenase ferredoxin reductase subunit [Microlunatus soli]
MDANTETGIVVVGGGLAAVRAIEEFRSQGYDGPLTLVAAESELPYERPVLSKGYLLGSEELDSAFAHDQQWYDDNKVEVLLGDPAVGLEPAEHRLTTAAGRTVSYSKLLLATGSEPRRLPLDGADAPNVLTLRNVEDAKKINAAIDDGGPLVIIGGGWIGLEVASAARQRNVEVTVLEAAELPLLGVLGREVAEVFAGLHREHGVTLVTGAKVAGFDVTDGVVSAVRTETDSYPAATVVLGVGAAPRLQLAEDAGLRVDGGVLTDGSLRTSESDIYAVGDIAAVDHERLGRVRVEHWAWANDCGPVAARAMLGQDATVDFLPFFFSDQYDLGMEYIGYLPQGSSPKVELRGDVAGRAFAAYWVLDGRVVAGMHANLWDSGIDPIKEIVQGGDPGAIPTS